MHCHQSFKLIIGVIYPHTNPFNDDHDDPAGVLIKPFHLLSMREVPVG